MLQFCLLGKSMPAEARFQIVWINMYKNLKVLKGYVNDIFKRPFFFFFCNKSSLIRVVWYQKIKKKRFGNLELLGAYIYIFRFMYMWLVHYSQISAPNSYTQTLRKNLVDIFLPPSKWNLRFKNNWKYHVLKNLPWFKNMSTTFPCIYNRLMKKAMNF